MEWSIQDVARITGTTSRTLRHYDDIGLLPPARVGINGYRYYDRDSMVRLQRILLLRELGLSLPVIAEVLARQGDAAAALRKHIDWLREEQSRIDRQIGSIERTLTGIDDEGVLSMETMFDGFDQTQYREEVEQRWGADAYALSSQWWDAMSSQEKTEWQRAAADLRRAWMDLVSADGDPEGPEAQSLAERHVAWLSGIRGTPATDPSARKAYVIGLGAMYVADPRFAANYGGPAGADVVRRALERYAEDRL